MPNFVIGGGGVEEQPGRKINVLFCLQTPVPVPVVISLTVYRMKHVLRPGMNDMDES
jgi:hypothetical protein